jgi:hypothetical protein
MDTYFLLSYGRLIVLRTLFNYLIGNADAHGKNISFLYQPHRMLSPFYDVLSTAIYPELNALVRDILFVEAVGVWVGTSAGLFFRAFDAAPSSFFFPKTKKDFNYIHLKNLLSIKINLFSLT